MASKGWLEVATGAVGLTGLQVGQRQQQESIERENLAAAEAMGWPKVPGKRKGEDVQTYVGENINVGNTRLAPLLLTALLTAAGLGGVGLGAAWLAGAFDDEPAEVRPDLDTRNTIRFVD